MTSPNQVFSSNSGEPEARKKRRRRRTDASIYRADRFCGRDFETSQRERICLNCHLCIVVDWDHPDIEIWNCPPRIIRQRRRLRNGNSS